MYHHFFMNQDMRYCYHFSKDGMVVDDLQRVPEQIRGEMSAVFNAVLQLRGLREKKFEGWRSWPNAYTMHPRGGAEHFLPLIVCAGAGGATEGRKYADDFRGVDMWSYYWDSEGGGEKL